MQQYITAQSRCACSTKIRTAWHALWCADTGTIRGAVSPPSSRNERRQFHGAILSRGALAACCVTTPARNMHCSTGCCSHSVCHATGCTSLDVLVRRMLCCTSLVVCCDGCADEGAHSQAAALFRSPNAQPVKFMRKMSCGVGDFQIYPSIAPTVW